MIIPKTASSYVLLLTLLLLNKFQRETAAFTLPSQSGCQGLLSKKRLGFAQVQRRNPASFGISKQEGKATQLYMYNLPPNRNKGDELLDILKGAGSLLLVVGFFLSPLGGFVLGIFNSFLLLSILLPVLGAIGFSTWQYFNTISGNCPNCGAPVRVLKTDANGEATPTICFSCGAVVQANYDNDGIDNVTGRSTVDDLAGAGGASLFDIFGGPGEPYTTRTTRTTTSTTVIQDDPVGGRKEKRFQRDSNIIDVEVEDFDKPWQ